eukprot:comp23241_c0_seq1/m.37939 comp23241_c0_seq1/g.37939  ORF comp23241_c0_seq1/g.37939 comp23241_c0_seq1/m.37939 type:complete len:355 (-) comp23241_c0_seq1:70-1134(-)
MDLDFDEDIGEGGVANVDVGSAADAAATEEQNTVVLMDDTTDEEEEREEREKDNEEDDPARRKRKAEAKQKRAEKRARNPLSCQRYRVINTVQYEDVVLEEYDSIDCRGASIVDGFGSEGLATLIAAQYLVDELKLPLIGQMHSASGPPLCVVRWDQPTGAVRIYGDRRLVVFTTPKRIGPEMSSAVVKAIFEFAARHRCTHVFTLEGVADKITIRLTGQEDNIAKKVTEKIASAKPRPTRYLTNDETTAHKLKSMGLKEVRGAAISGVTGGILSRAATSELTIVGLIAPVNPMGGDARAALSFVQTIQAVLGDGLHMDLSTLLDQAEDIETEVKKAVKKAAEANPPKHPGMYM